MEFFNKHNELITKGLFEVNEAKGTAKHTYVPVCGRCGGTGHYSFCQMYGTTCFGCSGTGKSNALAVETVYNAERLAKLNAAKAVRVAKKEAEIAAAAAAAKAVTDAKLAEFTAAHPAVVELLLAEVAKAEAGEAKIDFFLSDLGRKLAANGTLTEGQTAAAEKAVARIAERTALKAASQHIGVVGKRVELTLKIEVTIHLPSFAYGWAPSTIYLCRDENGNRVVYKGAGSFGAKGETVKVKATIGEHGERDGELQTIISRPKVLETVEVAG